MKNLHGRVNWKNELEEIVFDDFSNIKKIKDLLYDSGALYASLTGSGSAIYALSDKPIDIKKIPNKYSVWSGILNWNKK